MSARGGVGGLAVAGLRGHARRLGATVLAVLIGVAFVTTALLGLNAMTEGLGRAAAGDLADRDLVVEGLDQPVTAQTVDRLRRLDGVEVVDAAASVYGSGVREQLMVATTLPRGDGVALLRGELPTGGDEVAVADTVASASDLTVGDTITFTPSTSVWEGEDGGGHSAPQTLVLDVVGIVDVGNDPMLTWQDVIVASEPALQAWDPGLHYNHVTVDLAGSGPGAAREAIIQAAPGALVQTGAEAAAERVRMATGGLDLIGPVLLGFGAVALATSALVIANTFTIVLAQRTRELALLRCVGASRSQVRRTVLLEALLLGGVAATLGVLVGTGIAWAGGAAVGEVDLGSPVRLGLALSWPALVVPWVIGLAVTVAAAWWPTRRATRIAPLAALQPVTAPAVTTRPGVLRMLLAVLLLGAGVAALVYAAGSRSVPIGLVGGLLNFVGVLVAAVYVVPAAIRLCGVPASATGVPGRLAVGHALSNPGRVAATSAALLIGVTLITMTTVGAASASRTADAEINAEYPMDVAVTAPVEWGGEGGTDRLVPLSDAVVHQVAAVDGVTGAVPVPAAQVTLAQGEGAGDTSGTAYGIDAEAVGPLLRDASVLEVLEPGTVGMSSEELMMLGAEAGDTVTLTGPAGSVQVAVVELGLGRGWQLGPETLSQVTSDTVTGGLLVRLADDADVTQAVADIRASVEGVGASVGGGAAMRQELDGMLDIMVLVTTGLLGAAVLIAVVGIANTLSLSVLERTRENALLRALGLTRRQLRTMLTTEGVLVAVVSAALGVVLGTGYAWFGVQTLLPGDSTVQLALPWTRLAVVLGVALVAGLLASVLPARRAARIAPAAGLAVP